MRNMKYPKPPGAESVPRPPVNRSGSIPKHQRNPEIRRYLMEQERERLEREARRLEMRHQQVENRLKEIEEELRQGNPYPGQLRAANSSGGGWSHKKLKY